MYANGLKKNRARHFAALLLCLSLALALAACGPVPVATPELLPPVSMIEDTAAVTRRDIANLSQFSGFVRASGTELRFGDVSLKVKEIRALAGTSVEAGEVLVLLDTWQLEEDLADLRSAYARRQEAHAAELQVLESTVAIARAELDRLLWVLEESGDERDNASRSSAIILKTSEWESARLLLEQAKQRQAEELSYEEKEMGRLEGKMADAVLTAPFAGVVSQVSLLVGMAVKPHETVVVLTDPNSLFIEISKKQMYRMMGGETLTATINGMTCPVVYQPASNTEIAAYLTKGLTPPQRFALPEELPGPVTVGQYATVLARRDVREQVLTVPVNAVYYASNRAYVYRQEMENDGEKDKIPVFVELGVKTESYAEIIEGLSEGDVVFVN